MSNKIPIGLFFSTSFRDPMLNRSRNSTFVKAKNEYNIVDIDESDPTGKCYFIGKYSIFTSKSLPEDRRSEIVDQQNLIRRDKESFVKVYEKFFDYPCEYVPCTDPELRPVYFLIKGNDRTTILPLTCYDRDDYLDHLSTLGFTQVESIIFPTKKDARLVQQAWNLLFKAKVPLFEHCISENKWSLNLSGEVSFIKLNKPINVVDRSYTTEGTHSLHPLFEPESDFHGVCINLYKEEEQIKMQKIYSEVRSNPELFQRRVKEVFGDMYPEFDEKSSGEIVCFIYRNVDDATYNKKLDNCECLPLTSYDVIALKYYMHDNGYSQVGMLPKKSKSEVEKCLEPWNKLFIEK